MWIDQAVVRGGLAVFRCRLELGQAQRSVEVPQWMFDAASCHRMRLGPIPSVRWEVLRDLQALLSSRTQLAERDDLRDAQHRAEHGRGGADATITEPSACPSAVPVRPMSPSPPWATFPREIREQTVRLLARLLRKHRDGVVAAGRGPEAGDE